MQARKEAHRLSDECLDSRKVGGLLTQIQDNTVPPTIYRQTDCRDQLAETLSEPWDQAEKGQAREAHARRIKCAIPAPLQGSVVETEGGEAIK